MPKGSRLCTAIALSPDNLIIYAGDAAEKQTVHLFKASNGSTKPYASVQISKKITHLAAGPNGCIVTGQDFASFISVDSSGKPTQIKCKQGKEPVSHSSAAWTGDGMMLTGGTDGAIHVWNPKNGERAQKIDVDTSSIQTLACFPGVADNAADLVLVGGKENNLQAITHQGGKFKALWTIDVGGKPRSIDLCVNSGNVLLGLKNGSIVEMPMSNDGNKLQTTIMSSHCDGEVWGLQVVDLGGGNTRILTSADDNRIICYDGKTHRKLAEGHVG